MTVETPVPDVLRELWRQRARLLAANVATGSREHRELAQAASIIRQDYHDRFLIELLLTQETQGSDPMRNAGVTRHRVVRNRYGQVPPKVVQSDRTGT
jgi:hypothetical protein